MLTDNDGNTYNLYGCLDDVVLEMKMMLVDNDGNTNNLYGYLDDDDNDDNGGGGDGDMRIVSFN